MGRNQTKKIFLILAAILGLITGLLFYFYTDTIKNRHLTPTAVAQVAISRNVPVTPEMVAMEKRDLKGGIPVELDAVIGKVSLIDIPKAAIIVPSQLGPPGFANRVLPGKRAVSVAVDAVISVGGFVQPGDRVDVVATYDRSDQPYTQTILQDVELLAVGPDVQSKAQEDKGNGDTAQPDRKTAVLSVWPGQAQLLALWENHGKLRLVLRNPNDSTIVRVEPTVPPWKDNNPPPPPPPPASNGGRVRVLETKSPFAPITPIAPVSPVPSGPTIEVIRGNVRTLEIVSKG